MLNSTSEIARSARALHRVLTKIRYLALTGGNQQETVSLLDWAERLADDVASSEEHPAQFSEHLHALGEDHPQFAGIFQDYTVERIG